MVLGPGAISACSTDSVKYNGSGAADAIAGRVAELTARRDGSWALCLPAAEDARCHWTARRPEHKLTSMLAEAFERMLSDLIALDEGTELERARATFYELTGEFEPGDACYEERIQFFFDWFLVEHRTREGASPAGRWLDEVAAPAEVSMIARAALGAARSLYEVREDGALIDRLGGGRFRVEGDRFRPGDRFDGRLLAVGDSLLLAPGIVFHPPQVHEAMDELLDAIDAPSELDRTAVLDGLARMRMRLERFTSIRPKHIYRAEALDDRQILSAGWAKRSS
ncbi:MAG: hypothetical protein AB7S26_09390 [Sandaracinaceae bacterium]